MKQVVAFEDLDSISSNDNQEKTFKSPSEIPYDIVCVGFGAAALSIAIALRECGEKARVLFLESKREFGWHCGMLIPGARMQISFIKDLATLRNPQSHFTFLNYLHQHDRLTTFINLSTTLPLREEFNDYMRWCASHFDDWVAYGQEVLNIEPASSEHGNPIRKFRVHLQDARTRDTRTVVARHVILAAGGQPAIPFSYPPSLLHSKIIHSAEYMYLAERVLRDHNHQYDLAVIGGGQSAAEIFDDLSAKYPRAKISLISRASSLKPSDDSPFVNEIFDYARVNEFFSLPSGTRRSIIQDNRLTNYGVVRLELLEHLYSKLYHQRIHEHDEEKWRLRLHFNKEVLAIEPEANNNEAKVSLRTKDLLSGVETTCNKTFDLVFVATGYKRDMHHRLLSPLKRWLDEEGSGQCPKSDRAYRVKFREGSLCGDAGIWLQGCCEESHGLGDSLLSTLAVRSGELITSILSSRDHSNCNHETVFMSKL